MIRVRFIVILLTLMLVLALQGVLGRMGVHADLILAALVVAAFFLNGYELFTSALFSVWLLNWQPAPSVEVALILIFPHVAGALQRFFPYQPWLAAAIMVVVGQALLPLASGSAAFVLNGSVFIPAVLASTAFGVILFLALYVVYGSEDRFVQRRAQ